MKQKMKLITVLSVVSLGFALPSKAQWPTIGTNNIYYNNTGNVGIGTGSTVAPTQKLQVKGGNILLDYTNGTAGGNLFLGGVPGNQVNGMRLTCIDGSSGYIDVRTPNVTNGIIFRVDGVYGATERMRINGNGNVGIGASSPMQTLDVNGGINVTGGVIQKGGLKITTTADLGLYSQTPGNWVRFVTNGGAFRFFSDAATNPIGIGSTALFSIEPDGKVLIGNPGLVGFKGTPGSYLLYVQKGILTEKVKVAVATTADWSDYVFAKDYKLKTIEELEAFVKENKHLPNVPSAEEVVKEGVDMAKMDAKLLEKIEELSLYVIELKNESIELKKDNAGLLKRIEKIENK